MYVNISGLLIYSPRHWHLAGDDEHRREAGGYLEQVGGEVTGADRRIPVAVRGGREALQHLERVQRPAHAGAQSATLTAGLRKWRPTRPKVQITSLIH